MKRKLFVTTAVCFCLLLSACGNEEDELKQKLFIVDEANDLLETYGNGSDTIGYDFTGKYDEETNTYTVTISIDEDEIEAYANDNGTLSETEMKAFITLMEKQLNSDMETQKDNIETILKNFLNKEDIQLTIEQYRES